MLTNEMYLLFGILFVAIIAVILIAALYRWFLRRNRIDELHERKHHRQNNIDHTNPQNDETGDD